MRVRACAHPRTHHEHPSRRAFQRALPPPRKCTRARTPLPSLRPWPSPPRHANIYYKVISNDTSSPRFHHLRHHCHHEPPPTTKPPTSNTQPLPWLPPTYYHHMTAHKPFPAHKSPSTTFARPAAPGSRCRARGAPGKHASLASPSIWTTAGQTRRCSSGRGVTYSRFVRYPPGGPPRGQGNAPRTTRIPRGTRKGKTRIWRDLR